MTRFTYTELEQRDCKREIGRLLEKYLGAFWAKDDDGTNAVAIMHQHIDDHVQHRHDMKDMR